MGEWEYANGSDLVTDGDAQVDVVEVYVEALAVFGNTVRDVEEHEWDLPTPCHDWNIKEVVAHVVLGEAALPSVLAGEMNTTQAAFGPELLGSNPLMSWRGTALRAIEAAREPGVAERVFELDMGAVTGEQLLNYRITDNVVHAWDISTGAGRPTPIAEPQANWLLDFWMPAAAEMGDSPFFAKPLHPASDSASDRLLALLGRAPHVD